MKPIPVWMTTLLLAAASAAHAQSTPAPGEHQHEMAAEGTWQLMQDGAVFLNLNHQGGSRGGTELAPQNWWMGMAQRPAAGGTLRFNLMLSLDPATLGNDGYRELFQVGETLDRPAARRSPAPA